MRYQLVIILCLAFMVGCTTELSDTSLEDHSDHDHAEDDHHHHEMMEASEPLPSVALTIHDDPKSGWNLQMKTTNFELSPEGASLDHTDGQGHLHLHVDGKKITRIYNEWYHIPPDMLSPGEHEIKITLSTNNHMDLAHNGEVISDSKTITVS